MRLQRYFPYLAIFLVVETVLRASLLVRASFDVGISPVEIIKLFAIGLWFDVAVLTFLLIPLVLVDLILPARISAQSRFMRFADSGVRFVFIFILLFDAVAEHLFWEEFSARFNFIAVDYLVYTQEVIGNVMESYPVGLYLSLACALAAALTWLSFVVFPRSLAPRPILKWRAVVLGCLLVLCAGLYTLSASTQAQFDDNAEAGELASSGIYNFFAAFWNNEIQYDRFYAKQDRAIVAQNARALLQASSSAPFLKSSGEDLTRIVRSGKPEQHKNVMLIVMESLSADYMTSFGNTKALTPNLDALAAQGLFFTDLYATGTRTVRGLEAVTLSVPPTPGQSIVRRPGNDNLSSLGFVFKDRGYDTKFIYGGYGYFDNMNAFFSGNGFDIVDRNTMSKEEINFANVWGVCDEDMFTRSIKEADASVAAGKNFFHLVMTTSNHRPYTYPEGRIDIPVKSGREGGVKYADYAVGKLVKDVAAKPWAKDTIFVFIADHMAGIAGKTELGPEKYHIPMIIYAPGFVKPQRYTELASQIDMAPTLLGLMNFSYASKFYGADLLHFNTAPQRSFISNYQKVGLVKQGTLTLLEPKQKNEQFNWPDMKRVAAPDPTRISDAIAYYQSASWWKDNLKRIPTVLAH